MLRAKSDSMQDKWARRIPRKDKLFGANDWLCALHFVVDTKITGLIDSGEFTIPQDASKRADHGLVLYLHPFIGC
ncbi:hypothetical protein CHUAL_009564 [Chamberlinius hualienensis]